MRAIEFCIPALAYIFGFLLTTHIVQPVQDWALGVEVFGSLLFFPHAVRVLTAWLYGWKSIFLLMPGVVLGHYMILGLPGFTSGAAIGIIAGLVIVPLTFECFKRCGFDFFATAMHVPKFIPVFLIGSFASIFNAAIFNGFTGGQSFATLIFVIWDIGGLFVVCLFLMLIMRRQRTAADSQRDVAG